MLALDAVLVKMAEEASEVADEATLIVKLACKTIRFGTDSYHPRDPEQRSNQTKLLEGMVRLEQELDDLRVAYLLFMYQQFQFSTEESEVGVIIENWFTNEDERLEALRRLTKFDRLLLATKEKGSISDGELEKLQTLIMNVMNHLRLMGET